MQFWKGHALGNDYIVVDGTGRGALAPARIRGLCDRRRGIGADGVLVADLDVEPVGLRIFNPDGGEAEKSGNGLRIFGAWLHGQGRVADDPFRVALPGETVEMAVEDVADGAMTLRVDMGTASFRAGDVGFTAADPDASVQGRPLEIEPVAGAGPGSGSTAGTRTGGTRTVEIHLVSLGNPHCVVFTDRLDPDEFRRTAPRVQAHPAFARGVNVQLVHVAAPDELDIRIWERGAGETLASGSSACAAAVAARRARLLTAPTVRVRMPGGGVEVGVDEEWGVWLRGEARMVFRGELL